MDAKLNPDQAARIAGIAKWIPTDPMIGTTTSYWNYDKLDNDRVCYIKCDFENNKALTVTPAGFMDLLRVCEERNLGYEILSTSSRGKRHAAVWSKLGKDDLFTMYANIPADLPNALALAILKALEDK